MKRIRVARKDLIRAKGNGQDERMSEVAGEFTLTSSSELDELIVRFMSVSQETHTKEKSQSGGGQG